MAKPIIESDIESAALCWLESTGWWVRHGADLSMDTLARERTDYAQVVLERRLRDALARLNSELLSENQGYPSSSPARHR